MKNAIRFFLFFRTHILFEQLNQKRGFLLIESVPLFLRGIRGAGQLTGQLIRVAGKILICEPQKKIQLFLSVCLQLPDDSG